MTDSTWEILTNPDDERHGTENGYSNHGCRCVLCTEANAIATQEDRAQRAEREIPEHVHGTDNCYTNYRCRRPECKEAHNAAAREQRRRRKLRQEEAS